MTVSEIRAGIPALSRYIHLNPAGVAPTPRVLTDEIVRLYELIGEHGYIVRSVVDEITAAKERTRTGLASLLGVTAKEIAFIRSVSEGVSIIANGLALKEGDEVVITDRENPACLLPWLNLVRRKGIKVRKLALGDGENVLSRFESLLGDRTRMVAVSHTTSSPGIRLPVRDMCRIAKKRGIPVLLDGAQAAGCLDFNLPDIGCDFYVTTAYKWMMGPRGTALIYVKSERTAEIDVTWTGTLCTKSIDRERDEFELNDSALRFEFGSRHLPLYAAWEKSLQFLAQAGGADIEKRALAHAHRLKTSLKALPGVAVATPMDAEISAGIVVFSVEGVKGPDAVKRLFDKHRIVCASPDGANQIRFSTGFYLTDEEIDTAVAAVRELAGA